MAVEVNNKSYAKLMLHLVKHPHAPVSGYLIGTISESDEVSVEDIIPLFHTHILTPMLEVATNLIENSDNKIIGFYHVNERVDDRGIPIVVEAIATKVESNCPNSILLQVLNDKLVDPNEHALQAWAITKNGTWNRALEIQQCERKVFLFTRTYVLFSSSFVPFLFYFLFFLTLFFNSGVIIFANSYFSFMFYYSYIIYIFSSNI